MSTFEYNDLYLTCQNTGKYHMFIFDMIDSKNMSFNYRKEAQIKIIKLMNNMYKTIEQIEKYINKKILVFEEDFVTYESKKNPKGFGLKQEPFMFGDTFGFTIYRDSLDKETINYIYKYYKKELEIDFDFHQADGYYETNNYNEGDKKYFRGYCIDLLSTLHKKNTDNKLKTKHKKS